MWFLLFQIVFLMLLAAACGGALTWWWLRRGQEDVTEAYEEAREQLKRLQPLEKLQRLDLLEQLATRENLDAAAAHMVGAVVSQPRPDLSVTETRLAELERQIAALAAREPDQTALFGRLDDIGRTLAEVQTSVDGVGSPLDDVRLRLMGLEAAAEAGRGVEIDLGPVHSALLTTQLEIAELKAATPRLEPLHDRLATLAASLGDAEQRLQAARASDIDALTSLIAEVAASISDIPRPDLQPVSTELAALKTAISNLRLPEIDLSPVLDRLAALDREPAYLGELTGRLSAQEQQLRMLAADDQTRARLDSLSRQIQSLGDLLRTPAQPDYSPLLDVLYSIDGREDLAAVESRLTGLEYSLAALHHALRARPEAHRSDVRPRPQPPAQPRPVSPPEPPPEPALDPVLAARRPGDQANLLTSALFGPPDDLEQINGVGPILASLLRDIGVYYFWQVAEWSPSQVDWVDSLLQHFRGRIRRDDWVGHARQLASQPGAARRPARIHRAAY